MRTSNILKLFAFCLVLLTVRALKTHHYAFLFLIWNLLLAWIPYLIISNYEAFKTRKAQFCIIGLTVLFLPNVPYICTDLFHLSKNLIAPMWFDLILILSFSLLGLILFIVTTEKLFTILEPFFRSVWLFNCVKFLVILSNGYGIYLGRYLRFNSWDIISNPDDLVLRMFYSVFDSNNYKETLSITFTFTIFLYLIYEIYTSFKKRIEEGRNGIL